MSFQNYSAYIEIFYLPLPRRARGEKNEKEGTSPSLSETLQASLPSKGHISACSVNQHLGKKWYICSFWEFYLENAAQLNC